MYYVARERTKKITHLLQNLNSLDIQKYVHTRIYLETV